MGLKIVVQGGKRTGHEQPLEGQDVFIVGSAESAHLRLDDAGVQPNHVRIFRDQTRLILMDVSGVGVTVNGKQEVQAELRAGDVVGVGQATFRLSVLQPAAELRVLKGPDEGKTFPLRQRAVLGRGVTADIALLDMKCSREHCAVEKRADGFHLVDLGSTNGTKLNEVKLEPRGSAKLRAGDKLKLGGTIIEFHELAVPPRRPGASPSGRFGVVAPGPAAASGPVKQPTPPPTPRPVPAPIPVSSGNVFEIDLDTPVTGSSPIPIPGDIGAKRGAVTQRVPRPSQILKKPAQGGAALEGELEKMGFAEVVQFLNLSRKTGELLILAANREHGIAFQEGHVRDAWGYPAASTSEECFFGIARLRKGHFEFHEKALAREVKIKQPTMGLLMEAMRLVDEATDPGE